MDEQLRQARSWLLRRWSAKPGDRRFTSGVGMIPGSYVIAASPTGIRGRLPTPTHGANKPARALARLAPGSIPSFAKGGDDCGPPARGTIALRFVRISRHARRAMASGSAKSAHGILPLRDAPLASHHIRRATSLPRTVGVQAVYLCPTL